jgi:beta-phosphoglucomutase
MWRGLRIIPGAGRGILRLKLDETARVGPMDTGHRVVHAGVIRRFGLQAVLFDLDGVLVSTDRLHYRSWKALADSLGLPFDERTNHLLRGVSREESLRTIYRAAGRQPPRAAELVEQCAEKNGHYLRWISAMTATDVLPGASRLLNELRAVGIKVAVASASRNCRAVLERTELGARIQCVVDGNDVSESKPDPRVFLAAAERLGVLPADCVGVEDAATGVEAIRRAGMAAVGIGPAAMDAELHVATTSELTVRHLFKAFRQRSGKSVEGPSRGGRV